ncbi:IucC family-domain-containing protein [Coemansia spiralis]|nr:IucC family-domain-containing protein [Coemansia spiralis]
MATEWNGLSNDAVLTIRRELESSLENQIYAFAHRDDMPKLTLESSAIEWEQSIIEGHATHPMHRARHAEPPLPSLLPDTELRHIMLRFVAVPSHLMDTCGDYHALLMPLFEAAKSIVSDPHHIDDSGSAGHVESLLNNVDLASETIVPVHPLQLPAIRAIFPFVRELQFEAPAEAQASLRTLSPLALAESGLDIKLPLGIKTSSALRTVSTWSAFLGPRLTPLLPHVLSSIDETAGGSVHQQQPILLVAGEPASTIVRGHEMAKYLACIVRDNPQALCNRQEAAPAGSERQRTVVAAALTERNADGTSVVCAQWGLDTVDKKKKFLRSYVRLLFAAFLPPVLTHGFAFEAHQQNTLVRVDLDTGRVCGFVVRDYGGIMVHMDTFRQAMGCEVPMLVGNSTTAQSLDEVYDVAYHTLVQCQIHRLVRALDLHYSGGGWAVVHEELVRAVPAESMLYVAWMRSRSVKLKSFVAMKLGGMYRDYVYTSVPNLLHYQDEQNPSQAAYV